MNKITVGVLGATGIVGQRFIQLLAGHPWFQVTALAASDRSAGQRYADACNWLLSSPIPEAVQNLYVQPLEPWLDCSLVFSAIPSSVARSAEEQFASAGYAVCTNAAPHRLEPDVPLLIPEVNADHTSLIEVQRRRRGWKGLIVASANCSATPLALVLKPLHDAYGIQTVSVVTLQAISGAGYPGIPAADILGNIIPYIGNEEDKVENEPRKMIGMLQNGSIVDAPFVVSAQCNRVPVVDGHTACVSVEFESQSPEPQPDANAIVEALLGFRGTPEVANLPSTPKQPVFVFAQDDRPQPLRDRDVGKGMSVSVGRVRDCSVLDAKFVVLGHNTLRGAAGGAIHNAELLVAQGWIS